ncbi:MFS transporter [Pandoraea oxalativorans]|uniref:4-hydroxybenzoate transporter n=1 Tax=Pandoraea oxalativorans TaxID=573737 RepID=A0A0E3YGM7_9BURK|nr:MFS transporter [Pandoraea oxalativorans]AKC72175.2 4-hydroxybenzoate transporter [Pandoraea oxalativorans]
MQHSAPQSATGLGALIQDRNMSFFQIAVVAVCVAINMLDGFDVLALALTAPSIAKEWGLNPAALGGLFSASIAGIAVGSITIAPLADKFGRRTTVLTCLVILSVGMFASAFSATVLQLAVLRFVTGLGIGGVLPSINTLVAEYSSKRRRDLNISMMTVGYSVGASIGGLLAVYLVSHYGWHSVFLAGGALSTLMFPVALVFLPESLDFLVTRRKPGALEKVNRVLGKLGHSPVSELPVPVAGDVRPTLAGLFRGEQGRTTAISCAAFLLVMMTFYFLLNWMPKMLVDMGLSVSSGISGSVVMNLTGVVGGVALGLATARFGLKRMAIVYFVACFVCMVVFTQIAPTTLNLIVMAALVGFFSNGAVVCLYALAPRVFAPEYRATGTGLALGFGRLGGTIGPALAGVLIAADWSRLAYSAALTAPLLLACGLFAVLLAGEVRAGTKARAVPSSASQ